jgi:glycosyltransferase involved in cell wall biosynthesis
MIYKKVTFCIFTYNQEKYIKQAIESALSQDYPALEIIVSDDCSSDLTFEEVKKTIANYTGPHEVRINQNVLNMGIGAHFSLISSMATGDYIVCLGGDDISKDKHVSIAVSHFEKYKGIVMIDFNGEVIDSEGNNLGMYQKLENKVTSYNLTDYLKLKPIDSFAPGRILEKSLITDFDKISKNCPTEDSVLVLRSLLLGGLMRIDESLVLYRRHSSSISSSTNIRKLSNLAIVSQYYLDILWLFNSGRISESLSKQILKRVNYELKRRNLVYGSNNNYLSKLILHVRLKFMKLIYQITNF